MNVMCKDCGSEFQVDDAWYRRRGEGHHWRCKSCMSKYRSQKLKSEWANRTPEERADVEKKRHQSFANRSDCDKMETSARHRLAWENKSEEERAEINRNRSAAFAQMGTEQREKLSKRLSDSYRSKTQEQKDRIVEKRKESWAKKPEHEKRQIAERKRNAMINRVDDERIAKIREAMRNRSEEEEILRKARARETWDNKTEEERMRQRSNLDSFWEAMTDEDLRRWGDRSREYWENLPEDQKAEISSKQSKSLKEVWERMDAERRANRISSLCNGYSQWNSALTDEERAEYNRKRFGSADKDNRLHNRFVSAMGGYRLEPEFTFNGKSWDYGIYDKDDLIAVVDLDGAYFHGDLYDYDGLHSRLEYDSRRGLCIPPNTKWMIVTELNFERCVSYLLDILPLSYEEFIARRFIEYRLSPFPQPHYSDAQLIKSISQLESLDCFDKYHDQFINTRIGDRLIYNFYGSIWAHSDGKPSIVDAWMDDELLMDLVMEHCIYHCHLNPNKILQGIEFSEFVTAAYFDSPAMCKWEIVHSGTDIVEDLVFSPNRMLGAISAGKPYIFSDYWDEIQQNESIGLLEFIGRYFGDKLALVGKK